MNTVTRKNETASTELRIQIKSTDLAQNTKTSSNSEMTDSPRTFVAGVRPVRRSRSKTLGAAIDTLAPKSKASDVRTILRAQLSAGKMDSAEAYAGTFKAPTSPSRSASSTSASALHRTKFSSLTEKEAVALSDEAFDALDFGGDNENVNSCWDEWGTASDDENETVHKPAAKITRAANAKQVNEAGASSDDELHWNEWGITSDDED